MTPMCKDKLPCPNYWDYQPGWYGIPGAQGRYSTKVHLVFQGKPVCGSKLSSRQEFQWCARGNEFNKAIQTMLTALLIQVRDNVLAEMHQKMLDEMHQRIDEVLIPRFSNALQKEAAKLIPDKTGDGL